MSVIQYDPLNWLLTATRSLGSYVDSIVNGPTLAETDVEMSFPDTRDWSKETPLAKSLIHFEQDDTDSPAWGFGTPGVETLTVPTGYDPDNPFATGPQTVRLDEAQQHQINFDVGVWTSAESGGVTERMRLTQALIDLFTVAGKKQAMFEATGGLWVVSFSGGRNVVDRINDIPIYRALDMTLVIRVFSKHTGVEEVVPDSFGQDQQVTIADSSGAQVPVT